jgi:uncharacterized protein (TIGR02246 family)
MQSLCRADGYGACRRNDSVTESEQVVAIKRLFSDYRAAANTGDAAALASLFTNDGTRYLPNAPAAIGNEAVRSSYQAIFDQFILKLNSVEVMEVEAVGEWAFARGSFTLTLRPKAGGEPIEDTGNWLTVLKRQADGAWKIYRDMFNSGKPLPTASQ